MGCKRPVRISYVFPPITILPPKLVVSGEAETFLVLGQQFQIFKQENLIKSVNLARISMGREGGVDFSFNLLLDPIIFK